MLKRFWVVANKMIKLSSKNNPSLVVLNEQHNLVMTLKSHMQNKYQYCV